MDLEVLTAIIAVGGIATGIGAIWAAMVARRQLSAQAAFIREQTELARRQVELTEQSVAEQRKSLQLHDERERIRLEVSVMSRLWTEWTSPTYQGYRQASFHYLVDHYVTDGRIGDVDYIDGATRALFNFYSELGYLTRTGVVRPERVLSLHANSIRHGWAVWRAAALRERAMWSDPSRYADFEYLYGLAVAYQDRGEPSEDELLLFVQRQARTEEEMLAAAEGAPLPHEGTPAGGTDATGPDASGASPPAAPGLP